MDNFEVYLALLYAGGALFHYVLLRHPESKIGNAWALPVALSWPFFGVLSLFDPKVSLWMFSEGERLAAQKSVPTLRYHATTVATVVVLVGVFAGLVLLLA